MPYFELVVSIPLAPRRLRSICARLPRRLSNLQASPPIVLSARDGHSPHPNRIADTHSLFPHIVIDCRHDMFCGFVAGAATCGEFALRLRNTPHSYECVLRRFASLSFPFLSFPLLYLLLCLLVCVPNGAGALHVRAARVTAMLCCDE